MYINIDAATTEVMTKTPEAPATTGIVTVVISTATKSDSDMKK